MERWTIQLKQNDVKILRCGGLTVASALYKFIGLLFLKGLFCEADYYKLGQRVALKLMKKR